MTVSLARRFVEETGVRGSDGYIAFMSKAMMAGRYKDITITYNQLPIEDQLGIKITGHNTTARHVAMPRTSIAGLWVVQPSMVDELYDMLKESKAVTDMK